LDSLCPTSSGKIGGVIIKKSAASTRPISGSPAVRFWRFGASPDRHFARFDEPAPILTVNSDAGERQPAFRPSKVAPGNPSVRFERQNPRPAAPTPLLTVKTCARVAQPDFRPSKFTLCAASRSFDRHFAHKNPPNRFFIKDLAILTVGTARCAVRSAERSVRRCFPEHSHALTLATVCFRPFRAGTPQRSVPTSPIYWTNIIFRISSAAEAVRGFAT